MKYRPEIDGLRAVAVVPVVLFHAGVELFTGGYVGVDVFFVISGYLITSIIYRETIEHRFSLLEFYERRARRILPALLFVTSISIVLAWVYLNPIALGNFANSVVGVATFSSNIIFWLQQGYFEESIDVIPLIHTWSLGVEEQFYLIFPLLIILLAKLRQLAFNNILVLIVVGSLALSIWAVDVQSKPIIASGAFFLLPTRAWELGVGALIAILHHRITAQRKETLVNNIVGIFGMFLIILPMLLLDKNSPFPGIAAISPAVGTGLVIFYVTGSTILGRILSSKPLVFIGLASYSLYLWHQILLAFWRNIQVQTDLNTQSVVVLILISSILSYFSFRFIESPFRNRGFLNRKTVLTMSAISLAVIGVAGYVTKLAARNSEDWLAFNLSKAEYVYFSNIDERTFVRSRLKYDLSTTDAIIMGSSRAMQIGSSTIGDPALNLSVSGASVEDYVAFVPEAVKKVNASLVYLGADPWLFNAVSGQNRWKTVGGLYAYWNGVISRGEPLNSTVTYLESKPMSMQASSWAQGIYNVINQSVITTDNDNVEGIAKKAYDGFHIYNKAFVEKKSPHIERGFASHMNYAIGRYEDSTIARQKYKNLIHFLRESGIRVIIVMSPYHPDLFKRMIRDRPIILKVESDFRKIADSMNVPVIGTYDGAAAGCNVTEFYDGMHPKESCMKKVISMVTEK